MPAASRLLPSGHALPGLCHLLLPMLGMHDDFRWFTCSQDVGFEKPAAEIFQASFEQARFWIPDLGKHEVLHVGDSLA